MIQFTFEDIAHFGVLVIRFLVIATEDEDLVFVEGCPATATEEPELAFDIFDCRIDLCPCICPDVVDFDEVTVIALAIHTPQLDQSALAQRAECGVDGRMLACCDELALVGPGVEHLALGRDLIIAIHTPNNVYHLLQAHHGLARPSNI